jgi:hypothetical protein
LARFFDHGVMILAPSLLVVFKVVMARITDSNALTLAV